MIFFNYFIISICFVQYVGDADFLKLPDIFRRGMSIEVVPVFIFLSSNIIFDTVYFLFYPYLIVIPRHMESFVCGMLYEVYLKYSEYVGSHFCRIF